MIRNGRDKNSKGKEWSILEWTSSTEDSAFPATIKMTEEQQDIIIDLIHASFE